MPRTKRKRVGVGEWPRLTRFYGISPGEIMKTPNWLLRVYAEQLCELAAEEALLAVSVSTYPHATDASRDRMYRRLVAEAGIEERVQQVNPTTRAGKAALAGLGIGIRIDSSEESNDA